MTSHSEVYRPAFSSGGEIVLLAPSSGEVPAQFTRMHVDAARHARLLVQMQRLRGEIYSADGAIPSDALTPDGRHIQNADPAAWHILATDRDHNVQGCARYRDCTTSHSAVDCSAGRSALADSDQWGPKLRRALESAKRTAIQKNMAWVEAGGWALSHELRCTTRALGIALAAWGLGQALGGCIGVTTATRRHCSASILRRVGGRPLVCGDEELPAYYDDAYDCEMEILQFDSSVPNPRFAAWIGHWAEYLTSVPVICSCESERVSGLNHGSWMEIQQVSAA